MNLTSYQSLPQIPLSSFRAQALSQFEVMAELAEWPRFHALYCSLISRVSLAGAVAQLRQQVSRSAVSSSATAPSLARVLKQTKKCSADGRNLF